MKTPKKIHIGTSGWSYDHWKGPFYQDNTAGEDMLAFYAENFRTVEVNNTFYRLPSTDTLKKWKDTVPDDFLFSVKASRYITHRKKLKDPAESIEKFFEQIEVLDDKLGPILFQLPPRWHKNKDRLSEFIDALPSEYRYVFEFRDPTWFSNDIIDLLSQTNCAFCIYDLEGEQTPEHVTTDFIYIRLHGPGAKYQGSYSKDLLEKWSNKFDRWTGEDKEIFCYFNNDYEGHAPNNANILQKNHET
jgi:uncharacterized protein YecE (DUF72 family)